MKDDGHPLTPGPVDPNAVKPNEGLKLPKADPLPPLEAGDYSDGKDPYTYRVGEDGSITVAGGLSGTLSGNGKPLPDQSPIEKRIREGHLKKVEPSLADETMTSIRRNMKP